MRHKKAVNSSVSFLIDSPEVADQDRCDPYAAASIPVGNPQRLGTGSA
jgi:hypothetical protein